MNLRITVQCLVSASFPKFVEQAVAKQLTSHINSNKLGNLHQSAYKSSHSIETTLLSIKNEVQLSLA